jgi:acyl-coenzyme A thioesterase PaaI-like protein
MSGSGQVPDGGADKPDIASILARIPYARFIGMELSREGEELIFVLRYAPHIIGNPLLPALHGGVIGSFLETVAMLELVRDEALEFLPKPIDISIDFLRTGRPVDTFGRAMITKRGRQVANVRAEAWQTGPAKPIAILHGHFMEKVRAAGP